ncbi:hypothetical protein H0264_35785 [Nocardia huaxiensis]|uniref:Class I SAM-dependent methyltransferase n=2 Tax=Nocardia huaxiensis TaxID=2755382 RepID=A0A7D6Z1M0_9NOCA|nr:hypothetical protein H0264_35785 [Nocardia huaxiensis]
MELARKFPCLAAVGYDADQIVLDFAKELVRSKGLEHRCEFIARDVARDPPSRRSELTTFLAVRGLYPNGNRDLIRAMKRLTLDDGLSVVDGIWAAGSGVADQCIGEFSDALIEMGGRIVGHKERHFTLREGGRGVSSLWIVNFAKE